MNQPTTHSDDVRFAVAEDAESLLELIHGYWRDEEQSLHDFDVDEVIGRIGNAVHRAGSFIGVIGPVGGPLRGFIYMVFDKTWYSKEPRITCFATYVHPKWRKSNYARQLQNWAKAASDQLKIKLVCGVISDERTQAKVRLWQRHFKTVGVICCHDPNARG